MSILIQTPGILTTVQDLGRGGYRRLGINPGGAMDRAATRLVNLLVGNSESDAVLEMHFPAPVLLFEDDVVGALAGADFAPMLGGTPIDNWRPFFARAGQTLIFRHRVAGYRAYLAVSGGFKADQWLGSSSTNLYAGIGGHGGRRIMAGDRLMTNSINRAPADIRAASVSADLIPTYDSMPTVRVLAGAEYSLLDPAGRECFETKRFTIRPESNRMGYRLDGSPLQITAAAELISSAVDLGTVQLLPSGQMVILMADHQTTGGYPRIAHVLSVDVPLLAQLGPGDSVGFRLVTKETAEQSVLDFESRLNVLRAGCRLR